MLNETGTTILFSSHHMQDVERVASRVVVLDWQGIGRGPGAYERAPQCPPDETWSCVEKLGKTVSCSCSSRDELRRILEPERH